MNWLTARTVVSRSSTSTSAPWRALGACSVIVALLSACATTPAPDPLQLQLQALDARVTRIDRIVDNQSLLQMTQRVDALQAEVRVLIGRIEELQNANESLRKQQRDLYADLDGRLKSAPVPAATPAPMSLSEPLILPGGDEQQQYARAFEALKNADYAAAIAGFKQVSAAYPKGVLADNAQYWLGEAYYVTRDYDHAATSFEALLSTWPNSRKAPDALLKLGYTQFEQKRVAVARSTLQLVVSRFPGTDAARLAAERLSKLPADAR